MELLFSDSDHYRKPIYFKGGTEKRRVDAIAPIKQDEYMIYRMSQTDLSSMHKKKGKNKQKPKNGEPIVVINHLNSGRDITTMVDELLAKNEFSGASSIFIVVPSDDNEAGNSSDIHNSTICIQLSENPKLSHYCPLDLSKLPITLSTSVFFFSLNIFTIHTIDT